METKAEQVASELRREISQGLLTPGYRLEQRELALRFSMSPTPIREALRQLQAEGIVVYSANQGVTVADITAANIEALHEVYLMRSSLERLATELAYNHFSRSKLATLAKIQESFIVANQSNDREAIGALNYTFHMEIYKTAEAPRLLRFIQILWGLFPWETLWLQKESRQPSSSSEQHDKILKALTSGSMTEAGESMAEHISQGYEVLREYLQKRDQLERQKPEGDAK